MSSNIYKNKKPILIFLLPAFSFLTVFLYYPFVQNIMNSFQEIERLGTSATQYLDPWYSNYREMFQDSTMKTAFINTFKMLFWTVIGQVGIAIVLALLVDNVKKGKQFFRVVYFCPIVISATALGVLFNVIFLYDTGMINQLRELLGATQLVDFKSESNAFYTMMVPVVWQYVGFYFLIILTGLSNISDEIYEAACIDGASKLQCVRFISLPLVYNVIGTCMVLAVTGALKVFDLPWTMFPVGMPLGKTWLTGTYMYYQAFVATNVDYSSAIAVCIVVLGVLLAKTMNVLFGEVEY